MSTLIFSEWPGAWERHIIRKARHGHFFGDNKISLAEQLTQAKQRDQLELAQFNQHIGELALECTSLGEQSSRAMITGVKIKSTIVTTLLAGWALNSMTKKKHWLY